MLFFYFYFSTKLQEVRGKNEFNGTFSSSSLDKLSPAGGLFLEMGKKILGAMVTHWRLYPPDHSALSFQTSVGIKWKESDL